MIRHHLAAFLIFCTSVFTAELQVVGVKTATVYENKTYEHVYIQGSKYITLRNCTIEGATTVHPACIEVNGSSYITIENCTIDGNATICNGVNNQGSARLLVKGCRIFNCNDDGIEHHDGTLSDYVGNRIYNLRSCGTDNGCSTCNNGHSDGVEIWRGLRVNLIGNMHYGTMGTSCLILGQGDPVSTDITLYNNIFYSSNAGYTTYLWYCNRLKAYNNVFWHAKYGAVWWGKSLTDAYFRNNILGGKWRYEKVTFDAANHHIDNNLFTVDYTDGSNNIKGSDPQFAGTPSNTSLNPDAFKIKSTSPCIDKGIDDGSQPETDMFSLARKGLPDIGVHEYGGTYVTGTEDYYANRAIPEDLTDVLTLQVYPAPMTEVAYFSMARLEVAGPVRVTVYDQQGRTVRLLESAPGSAVAAWDGKDNAGRTTTGGMYFYAVTADDHYQTGTLLKQ